MIANPCFMPGAAEFLNSILHKDMTVFEWGSGASTRWFADRVGFIYSVEHQRKWFTKTVEMLAKCHNFKLNFQQICPIKDYVESVHKTGIDKFDLIIIDGRHRVECLKEALKRIKLKGFIIFDDIERWRYSEAASFLEPFQVKSFPGCNHRNCIFDDDPSGITKQITNIYRMDEENDQRHK